MSVHVSGIIQYLLFCTSFHIHLVASLGISFLYMDEYYSTLWTDHTWFIYSSLGCFHLLAIVNNAAKSRGVQVSLRVPAVSSSRYISRSEMATHPSVLVWRIPGMGEPGGLPSLGLHRVGHDWSDLAAAAAAAVCVSSYSSLSVLGNIRLINICLSDRCVMAFSPWF